MSSHWAHYSRLARIDASPAGHLRELVGVGFGRGRWQSMGEPLVDGLSIADHLVRLRGRSRLARLYAIAVTLCRRMGLHPTFDVFRQVCTADLLLNGGNWSPDVNERIRWLMIGDGYGVLSVLLKTLMPRSTIFLLDIDTTLLFQAYHCDRAFPKSRHALVEDDPDPDEVDFVYCGAHELDRLESYRFEGAVTVAAMQEMTAAGVARYFASLRRCLVEDNLFYCCARESKRMIGGEVSDFYAYPWQPSDRLLVDGRCPWHQYFYGLHSTGPFRFKVPRKTYYEGPVHHRLAVLHTEARADAERAQNS